MSSSKRSKPRGRPPKYVLDDDDKEVVGLSYNDSNKMYYATGTNPRHYFSTPFQIGKRPEAIRQFYEWKKSTGYTKEEIEQQKYRNEIYQKAVSLIEDGHFNELIEIKARELIDNDLIVKDALLERTKALLTNENLINCAVNKRLVNPEDQTNILSFISQTARSFVKEWISRGDFDKEFSERACDLIAESPFEAAKTLGIKEVIYADVRYELPFMLGHAWPIFNSYRDKKSFLYDSQTYSTVWRQVVSIFGNSFLDKIKYADLRDVLLFPSIKIERIMMPIRAPRRMAKDTKKGMVPKSAIPIMDRLEILEDIFTTVKNAGYDQADHILKHIRQISYNLPKSHI